MTTLIGIKTNTEHEAIVLGADTQMAIYEGEKPVTKKPLYKIVSGDFWSIAHSGAITDELRKFYNRLTKPDAFKNFGKEKLRESVLDAVKKKRFRDVNELNAEYYRKESDTEDLHEFLFAVNDPELRLFHIDPFGNLKSSEDGLCYLTLGTGEEEAGDYIEEKLDGEHYDSGNVNLEAALRLCRESLKKASSRDMYSGGPIDFAVIRKDDISTPGKRLEKAIEAAEKEEFEQIIRDEIAKNGD